MSKIIKCKSPFFSAWKKFGWDKNTWGATIPISILRRLANKGEKIIFKYRKVNQSFEIDAKEALDFVTQNKSEIMIDVPQRAGVIPVAIMKKVKDENNASNNNLQ